jgi:uncharacterized protein YjbI with pentapeptide repeats
VVITSKEFLVGSVFSKLKLSKGLMAGLLLGGTLGSFGVAAATSSPSTTVFYACSAKTTGILSAISTKAPTCANTATLVSWNSVGPQGAPGPTGPMGPQANSSCLLGGAYPNLGGCELSGINLDGLYLQHSNFANADLSGASLNEADLRVVNFKNANLSGANLYGVNLSGANLSGANLHGADLDNAILDNANLHGADLTNATCPNGVVHLNPGANC